MTNLTYNGLTLLDVLTESIEQVPEYDSSGADLLYIHTRIRATGVVHTHSSYTLGVGASAPIAENMNHVLGKLSIPRRPFRMTVGGRVLFDILPGAVPPGGGPVADALNHMDVNNGPKPSVRVLGIAGESSSRIEFAIEFCTPPCARGVGNGILNLRWWIADDVDGRTMLTRRVYHGRIRLAHNHLNPHAFRNFAIPPVYDGFRPEDFRMDASEDGLTLDFTVTHQEQWAMAPGPATDWDGTHTITSPTVGSPYVESEIRVRLAGPKNVDKRQLVLLADRIMRNKLHFFDVASERTSFITAWGYEDNLSANQISAWANVRIVHPQLFYTMPGISGFGSPLSIPGYNKEKATLSGPTATVAWLFLAALQTSCQPGGAIVAADSAAGMKDFLIIGRTGENGGSAPPPSQSPQYPSNYDQSHIVAMHVYYKETNDYEGDSGRIVLPVGKSSQRNAPSSVRLALYPPQAKRTIRISAQRLNMPPDVPKPEDFRDGNGIEHWLTKWNTETHAPQPSADSRKMLYTVDYTAEYRLDRAPRTDEKLDFGRIPIIGQLTVDHLKYSSAKSMVGTVTS